MESGKLLPGVKVIIANPETKGQCGDSHLGEASIKKIFSYSFSFLFVITNYYCLQIWVQSPHNASGYFTIYGDDSDYGDHFNAKLVTGSNGEVYARTGYLGFLRRTEGTQQDGNDVSGSGGGEENNGSLAPGSGPAPGQGPTPSPITPGANSLSFLSLFCFVFILF